MRRLLCLAAAFFALGISALAAEQSAPLTADQIMARVAANQDRTEAARSHYIYLQHIRTVSRKPGGRVMCEEVTDSRVTPLAHGSHQELLKLDGRHWHKGQYVHYTTLQQKVTTESKKADGKTVEAKSEKDDLEGMDVDLVENLRDNLTNEKPEHETSHEGIHVNEAEAREGSRDGLARGLFPLTTKKQRDYLFQRAGQQMMNGRNVYRVSFRPKDKNDFDWKGEAYIDREEFEPVVVYTQMSRKIPLAVRTLLGTNVPGLGFSVTYARQPDGVWFPVGFGTEFRMRVLFFIARDISMSLSNTQFEKTHTDIRILEGATPVADAGGAATSAADH
jgi:hypothetical protein